eukprot:GHRR01025279.1.p1 GENE.GHRR01025279.1~~GHRR01025279.1.p1  ORF type:complete len:102 (-),score=0.89 GHRR01025279.1:228-533(-)
MLDGRCLHPKPSHLVAVWLPAACCSAALLLLVWHSQARLHCSRDPACAPAGTDARDACASAAGGRHMEADGHNQTACVLTVLPPACTLSSSCAFSSLKWAK